MTVASTIFVIIAVAFASSLATGLRTYQTARARTLAQLLGTQQIEEARRLDYDDLGVILGNPPGLLQPARTVDVDGYEFFVATSVGYVDDPLPNGFQTSANYKLVTVIVTSPTSGTKFAELVTKVAPPTQPSLNKAVAEIQVVDDSNQPIPGVVVDLDNGPSSDRFAVTDEDGWVLFPALDPNPATGPQARYDIGVEVAGFVIHPDDVYKASLQLNPSQRLRTGIRMIRPVTASVSLVDAASVPFTADSSVQISWDSGQQRSVVPVTAGTATIAQVGGVVLAPNREYTLSAYTSTGWFSAAVTALVPDAYPDDLDTAFTLQLAPYTVSNLQVRVRESGTLKRINGARVVIEGGPASVSLGGVTPINANFVASVPVSGASYTVRVIAAGYNSSQASVTLPGGGTIATFNLTKAPG
jgi:hypothetical protein